MKNKIAGRTPVLLVGSQKGGLCKSSLALNLAGAWAEAGRRVLCLDLDSQGNLSQSLEWQGEPQVVSIFAGRSPKPVSTNVKGLDLLAADRRLSGVVSDFAAAGQAHGFRLRDYLAVLQGYDIMVIDTPPTLGGLTLAGLMAATHVVIPVTSQYFSLKGTAEMLATLSKVREHFNPGLTLMAAVVAMHSPGVALASDVVAECRRLFGSLLVETMVPRTVKVEESQVRRLPVCQAFPTSKVAAAYRAVAAELWARLSVPVAQKVGK
jgi:chromosome partitioning protein